jgi:hypothetical protein
VSVREVTITACSGASAVTGALDCEFAAVEFEPECELVSVVCGLRVAACRRGVFVVVCCGRYETTRTGEELEEQREHGCVITTTRKAYIKVNVGWCARRKQFA